MFISLRNLLGLRYQEAQERERDRERRGGGEKWREMNRRRNSRSSGRSSGTGGWYLRGPTRVPRGSFAVVGTSLRNVHAVFAD